MDPVTITLGKPIVDFNQPITALVISREAEFGDLIEMESVDRKSEKTLVLIQRLYRTPEGKEVQLESLRHLRPSDAKALDKAMVPFLDLG